MKDETIVNYFKDSNCRYKALTPFYHFLYKVFGLVNCRECGNISTLNGSNKHMEKHKCQTV